MPATVVSCTIGGMTRSIRSLAGVLGACLLLSVTPAP